MSVPQERTADLVAPSPDQEALWFLDSLAAGSPGRTVCRAFLVTGELDTGALRAAWDEVVARHDILRTRLVESSGRLSQEIVADVESSFVDVAAGDPAAWATMPFPHPPRARLVHARLGPADHLVLVVAHHAVADSVSMSIVVEDLFSAYTAAVGGEPVRTALPAPAAGYAEYARWHRRHAAGPAGRRQLRWWNETLASVPAGLALPTDRARPAEPSTRAGVVRFEWTDVAALSTVAEREEVPPYAVLLAAFQTLLWRYGDEDRVPVGMPVAVRPRPEFARTVGRCDNPVTVCADFTDRPAFRDLLGRVARQAAAALDHRELPFAEIVRALNPPRDPHRIPWHDAVLDVVTEPDPVLAGAVVRATPADGHWTLNDLKLTVTSTGPVVAGALTYRADLFDHASATRILEQLHTLLAAALAAPRTAVDELPLDATPVAPGVVADVPERPAHELVRANATRLPDACAVACAGPEVSYSDLVRHADEIAAALGDVAGAAVLVRVGPGPHQYAALLGVLAAGAHLVWFGTDDAGERGRAVLTDLRPACILLDRDPAEDALATWYRDEQAGRVLDIRTRARAGAAGAHRTAPAMSELAYIAYTSGSTGRPKGIPHTHATLAQFACWFAEEFHIGPGARVAQWVAPEHDPALCEVFATLTAGATLCQPPARVRANPDRLAAWLADEAITHVQLVPSFAKELLAAIAAQGLGGRLALTHLLLMGEVLPAELVNGVRTILPDVRVVNLYGPTETVAATWYEITGATHGSAPVGRPIPGRQVLVVDDQDRPCPAGVTGEIVVIGPYVTPGYTGAASADRVAFAPLRDHPAPAGCYRTGDLARWRWDGQLEFRGRKDFQVKLAGNRVELSEIEAVLAAHATVAECAARAVTDQAGLTVRLAIYVVPVSTSEGGTPAVWRACLRRAFGALRLPTSFTVLDLPLPRNVAGKVDRRRLPDPVPAAEAWSPHSIVHSGLSRIWAELLGVRPTTAEETFFAAGGHSLLLPRLAHLIHRRFGVATPVAELLANPTVAGLAALIEDALQEEPGRHQKDAVQAAPFEP